LVLAKCHASDMGSIMDASKQTWRWRLVLLGLLVLGEWSNKNGRTERNSVRTTGPSLVLLGLLVLEECSNSKKLCTSGWAQSGFVQAYEAVIEAHKESSMVSLDQALSAKPILSRTTGFRQSSFSGAG
jgi:hypothetical protein